MVTWVTLTLHVQSFNAMGDALTPAEEITPNTVFFSNNLFHPDLDQLEDGRLVITRNDYLNTDIYRTVLDKPPAAEFGSTDVISGTAGNDIIDTTFIDNEGDAVSEADDFVLAGAGDDIVISGHGDDIIYGGGGDDQLLGGAGNDTLTGDVGADVLTGETGADVFVFKPSIGIDAVTDFNETEGDLIQLYGVSGQAEINLVHLGSDTEVRTTSGDLLAIVEGVQLLDYDSFLFS